MGHDARVNAVLYLNHPLAYYSCRCNWDSNPNIYGVALHWQCIIPQPVPKNCCVDKPWHRQKGIARALKITAAT